MLFAFEQRLDVSVFHCNNVTYQLSRKMFPAKGEALNWNSEKQFFKNATPDTFYSVGGGMNYGRLCEKSH